MAFTIGREISVFGNKRVALLSCSVDSASGNIVTGLNRVDAFTIGIVSAATAGMDFKRNVGSGATAIPGNINIDGATSGDVFFLVCYGV